MTVLQQVQQDEDGPEGEAPPLLQHRRLLHAFFVRRLSSRQDAEDYVQEVYRRVLDESGGRRVQNWRAFLLGVATNLLRDGARRAEVRRRDDGLPQLHVIVGGEPADEVDPERIVGARQQVEQLERALARLDPLQRQIFVLARLEELPHREIGERVGLTQAQVGQQVARLMRILAKEMLQP